MCGPGRLCLCALHGATYKDEGVVTHVSWDKGFSGQVRDPMTELIVKRRDQAALFAVKGVVNGESNIADIT